MQANAQDRFIALASVRETIVCDHPLYRRFLKYAEREHRDHRHLIRYCRTLAFLLNSGVEPEGKRISETGYSPLLLFFEEEGFNIVRTQSDLRYAIDLADASVDLLLSLEVLEHIKDQESAEMIDICLFNGSGARRYASEIERVLAPGGYLMLTTPNPNSALALKNIAEGRPPWIFDRHVREYTADEVRTLFSGIEEMAYSTEFCFGLFDEPGRRRTLLAHYGEQALRFVESGDDHFFLYRKP